MGKYWSFSFLVLRNAAKNRFAGDTAHQRVVEHGRVPGSTSRFFLLEINATRKQTVLALGPNISLFNAKVDTE